MLIAVLDKRKEVKFYNGLRNERSSVLALRGYFNITIKNPKDMDIGTYRCVFTTEERVTVSATIFLLGGRVCVIFVCQKLTEMLFLY